eukprot:m.22488 g.22488  ORF g.22488 m.22488 type:complete len:76 (+) comp8311_c0_seq1:3106-3333(+)
MSDTFAAESRVGPRCDRALSLFTTSPPLPSALRLAPLFAEPSLGTAPLSFTLTAVELMFGASAAIAKHRCQELYK